MIPCTMAVLDTIQRHISSGQPLSTHDRRRIADALNALRADKVRLDWIQKHKHVHFEPTNLKINISGVSLFSCASQHVYGNDVREAIDTAILRSSPNPEKDD